MSTSPMIRRYASLFLTGLLVAASSACGSDGGSSEDTGAEDGATTDDGADDAGGAEPGDGEDDGSEMRGDDGGSGGDDASGGEDGDDEPDLPLIDVAIVNHSFEAVTLAPGEVAEGWSSNPKTRTPALPSGAPIKLPPPGEEIVPPPPAPEPTDDVAPGTGHSAISIHNAAISVLHPDETMVAASTPLAAPADGNNAVWIRNYGGAGTFEAELRSDVVDAMVYGDTYELSLALAQPSNATAPSQISLVVRASEGGAASWTAAREVVTLGEPGVFEARSLSFTVPRELHGMSLYVGVHVMGTSEAGLLVDNLALARRRPEPAVAEFPARVLNGSFESPALADGMYLHDALHWTTSGQYVGITRHGQDIMTRPLTEPAAGEQVLELDRFCAAKTLAGTVVEGQFYRARAAYFARLDTGAVPVSLLLWAGDTLGSATESMMPASTPQLVETCFAAGAEVAGQPLYVSLESGSTPAPGVARVLVDNVQVDVSDEPCPPAEVIEQPGEEVVNAK